MAIIGTQVFVKQQLPKRGDEYIEVTIDGRKVCVVRGKLGTQARSKRCKSFQSDDAAEREFKKHGDAAESEGFTRRNPLPIPLQKESL